MLKVPVTHCETTSKLAYYQTALQVADIVPHILSGYDPRSSHWGRLPPRVLHLYEKLQRKMTKSRREEIERYILNRMSPKSLWIGAFPPLVIAVPPPQDFKLHDDQDSYEGVGLLRLNNDMLRPNVVIDGLGRLTGFLEIAEDEKLQPEVREWVQRLRVPILMITGAGEHTLTEEELGQLFYDFNVLATPVSKGHAIDLDLSDQYIVATCKIGDLRIVRAYGGMDDRATTITRGRWTAKAVLLKAVRAAAEGPGAHVDHVRETIDTPWMNSPERQQQLIDRFDAALTVITGGEYEPLPPQTLLRTPVWWVALGLLLHDLYRRYKDGPIPTEEREAYIARLAAIDWSLGNPEFAFLGDSAPVKDRKTGAPKPVPTDAKGRPVLTRFHGGAKAYFNLAAYLRRKIGLYRQVNYGADYGASIHFDDQGGPIAAAERQLEPA